MTIFVPAWVIICFVAGLATVYFCLWSYAFYDLKYGGNLGGWVMMNWIVWHVFGFYFCIGGVVVYLAYLLVNFLTGVI